MFDLLPIYASLGITIFIDDAHQMVRIKMPAKAAQKLPKFIQSCHEHAGNLGYGIQFEVT